MAFKIEQGLRLSQNLVMTPQLQQAIKLLQLNRMELLEVINQELTENPVLDEVSDGEVSPEEMAEMGGDPDSAMADPETEQFRDEQATADAAGKVGDENVLNPKEKQEFDWEQYVEESQSYQSPSSASMKEINDELPSFENALTKSSTLEEHLLWQLSMSSLLDNEQALARNIIGNLNDDGYLVSPLEELVKDIAIEMEDAEEILKILQGFDPIGVCARNLQECLIAQAKLLQPRQPIVEAIIEKHISQLERRNYQAIAKALGCELNEVVQASRVITEFEPKPGRSFQTQDAQYITPDIYVSKVGDDFVIVLNEDGLPRLRISPYYKNVLAKGGTLDAMVARSMIEPSAAEAVDGVPAPEVSASEAAHRADVQATAVQSAKDTKKATKEYVQDKLRSALWLIRSIHNRQKTIYKVTEAIVKRQREFFEKGVQFLKPMILKDVAGDIGMHESTISRVTTNKYMHTPVGIFELKYFFNSSIGATDGSDSVASEAVKMKIKQLVANEDPKNPVSDQKLVELLRAQNIEIARRTVAKYRDMLGILPSSRRKRVL